MTIQDQIYAIWFPLGIMLVFAVIGVLRGVVREAIVAVAIMLASLIITLWAGQWGEQVHSIYSGMTQGQEEFTLSFAVLWLVVLVVGYGMGGFAPRVPLTNPSRLGGFLLGLMNGGAVAGWSLRFAWVNLHGAQPSSPFYTNPVSYSLMVWAAWFPIALVLLGALLVLVGPLRRAQTAVSQPSAGSDWEPYAARPTATAPASSYQGSRGIVSPSPGASSPAPSSSSPTAPTMAFSTQPAPGPAREASTPSPWAGRQEPPALGQAYGERERGDLSSARTERERNDPGTYNSAGTSSRETSSWLLQPTGTASEAATSGGAASGEAAGMSAGSQATHTEARMAGDANHDEGATMPVAHVDEPVAGAKCPNCGAPAAPGAIFCTECGTKLV